MKKGKAGKGRFMGVTVVMWILSLIYVVMPTDLVPDIAPVIGWLDDLVVLLGSVSATAATVYATMPKKRREQGELEDAEA